ncbi:MAG: calcium/sodium antiporter [Alkalispirochaeta sp.]
MAFEQSIALNSVLLAMGTALLYGGGSFLVQGAARIALRFNISSMVVGLTVVAFGTSAPELFVSLLSAVQGKMGISIGNVVGSNVINIALVLGIAAVLRPTPVDRTTVLIDGPVMMFSYVIFMVVAADVGGANFWTGGIIERWEGGLMVAALGIYVFFLYERSRASRAVIPLAEEVPVDETGGRPFAIDLLLVLLGTGFLAGGAELLVQGAGWLAMNLMGASERFVGIAIVALGTSLPELVTTLVSLGRGEMEISVGNLIGSNIFNTLFVLGVTSMVLPITVGTTDFSVDFFFMVATTLILVGDLAVRRAVSRSMGVVLLTAYASYVVYLAATRAM